MSVVTEIAEFRTVDKKRTILCGPPPANGVPNVQISDATYTWTDPVTGATDVIGATGWWKLLSMSISSTGTVVAEVIFQESDDLLAWLCANNQVAQLHMHSAFNFTVSAKFLP